MPELKRTRQNLYEKYGFALAKQRAKAGVKPPPLVLPQSVIPNTAGRGRLPFCHAYGRVSTADQTCETQQMMMTRHYEFFLSKDYDWGGYYADPDVSGAIDIASRPAGALLMERLQFGDAVMVSTFDRLTRSLLHWATFRELLKEGRYRLIIMDMAVDSKTADGRFALDLLAAKAENEREKLSERIRNRNALDRARKLHPMTKPAPWGYEAIPTDTLVTHAGDPYGVLRPFLAEQVIMRMLYDWNAVHGVSQRTIIYYLHRRDFRCRNGSPMSVRVLADIFRRWEKIRGTADDVTNTHEFWKDGNNAPMPGPDLAEVGINRWRSYVNDRRGKVNGRYTKRPTANPDAS